VNTVSIKGQVILLAIFVPSMNVFAASVRVDVKNCEVKCCGGLHDG
jgi:hypothetical protein